MAAGFLGLLLNVGTASANNMEDTYDKIWGHSTLYSNKENSLIQKLAFTGRLQYDYAYFDEDEAGWWDDTAWRRARAGFKASVLNGVTLHIEANLDFENTDPVYDGLTDAYIGFKLPNGLSLKLGKQGAPFTMDGATSSKRLITTERGGLSNNLWFTREYFIGASLSGGQDNWTYKAGVFSNDASDEFENFADEKFFILLSVGYDFAEELDVDTALLRLDYVYNDESDNLGTKALEQVISLNWQYDNGRYHLRADLARGEDFNGENIWGFQIMPFIDLNDTFQIVGAYNYLSSSSDNGISLNRYERRLVGGKADQVEEFFLGLNTYFYGHKLKWQNGFQFTKAEDSAKDGGDYSGTGFTSAIRLYW